MIKNFLVLMFISVTTLTAQVANFSDFGGKPVNAARYSQDIQGSPFLSPNYQSGDILLAKKVLSDKKLLYDMFTDELLIKDAENVLIVNSNTIKGFVINVIDGATNENTRYTFKNGFKNVDKYDESAFFCIYFETEKVKLISKKYVNKAEQAATYGSTGSTTVFSNYEKFFLIDNGVAIPFKKGKNLLKVLKDDGTLKKYAQINKIDLSTTKGMEKIMQKYISSK